MPDPVIVSRATQGGKGPLATIERLLDTLFARVHALEMRPLARNGMNGKDADPELVRQIVAEEVAKTIAALPKRKRVTKVTKHDDQGRILEFEQEEE